jgi:hypothetical protein
MTRVWIAALAMAAVAGTAGAQAMGYSPGRQVREALPTPSVPSGARKEAEVAIEQALGDPDAKFRAVRANEVAAIRHKAFEAPVDGPLSLICGQVSSKDGPDGAYGWFLVAIKRDHVLWTTLDDPTRGPGEAYYSCKGAGLAE